ncbi:unnamed protein product [Calypogeia fissa]
MTSSALLCNLGQVPPCTVLNVRKKPNLTTQRRQCLTLGSKIWGSNLKEVTRASSGFREVDSFKLRAELTEEEEKTNGSSKTTAVEEPKEKSEDGQPTAATDKKQEMDWKKDEDVKKFLSNPSIETLLKVEAKRAEQRLKELETQDQGNFFNKLFADLRRNTLKREKERLDQAQLTFKALDLNELKKCFGYDTFFATEVRRFGDGGIFIGNIRRPLEEVKGKLEAKLTQAAGMEVDVWFLEETSPEGEKKHVCVVQPKAEIDLQFNTEKLSNVYGYFTSLLLGVTTVGTIALMSGFFLEPGATFDDYVARVLPLFGGFLTILITSDVATRLTAAKYGVTLSPTFLIPSTWTGCLGVVNNIESLLPTRKALFDIAAARITSAYLASGFLALVAFYLDGSFNGGDNALIIRPQFFYNNPLLSFVQYSIGPYSDELGNVLPQAVPGVGVPVDPLAFAGLLGIVITSLNVLPCGKLEGGRMTQALFGRRLASRLSFFTSLILGLGGLSGSVVALVWAFIATFFRGGEELPAQDEITPLGQERYIWGFALAFICLLSLFPNSAGTFPSPLYTPPFFRGDF